MTIELGSINRAIYFNDNLIASKRITVDNSLEGSSLFCVCLCSFTFDGINVYILQPYFDT